MPMFRIEAVLSRTYGTAYVEADNAELAREMAGEPETRWDQGESEELDILEVEEVGPGPVPADNGDYVKSRKLTEAELIGLNRSAPGTTFLFNNSDPDDAMSYETLAYAVREDPHYGFADGDTIAEAGSHSDQELWTDVIVPAIVRGEIEVTIDGRPIEPA